MTKPCVNLVITKNEVSFNGKTFVPEDKDASVLSIFLIRDNCSTIRIYGVTFEELQRNIIKEIKGQEDLRLGVILVLHRIEVIKKITFMTDNLDGLMSIIESDKIVQEYLHTNIPEEVCCTSDITILITDDCISCNGRIFVPDPNIGRVISIVLIGEDERRIRIRGIDIIEITENIKKKVEENKGKHLPGFIYVTDKTGVIQTLNFDTSNIPHFITTIVSDEDLVRLLPTN